MWVILLWIAMFMFLVVIHELGHFWAAKKTWVKVEEFGVWIPPKAFTWRKDKKGTEYTINWIPLGGFVRLKGENPDDPETFLAKDSFITASLWHKIVILFAWVTVNAIFAWLAFSAAFMHGIHPITVIPDNGIRGESRSYLMPTLSFLEEQGLLSGDVEEMPATITQVLPDGVADTLGVLSGDIITHVNDAPVTNLSLWLFLKQQVGKQFTLKISRNGEAIELPVTCGDENCFLGVSIVAGGQQELLPIKFSPLQALAKWGHEVVEQTRLTLIVLGKLGSNLLSGNRHKISGSLKGLSGPVGIVKFGWWIRQYGGAWLFLAFAGMISLALAVFNVLPIPALDGGRAVGVLIQAIARRKPQSYFVIENYFNMFFFIALMILGVYIILLDLERWRGVHIPFINS